MFLKQSEHLHHYDYKSKTYNENKNKSEILLISYKNLQEKSLKNILQKILWF